MAETPKTIEVAVDVVGLHPDMQVRVLALKEARAVLVARNAMGGTGNVDAMDLVNIAAYIISGADPWADIKVYEPPTPKDKSWWKRAMGPMPS